VILSGRAWTSKTTVSTYMSWVGYDPLGRPFRALLRFGQYPGLKPWAILFCHFMANAVRVAASPCRRVAHPSPGILTDKKNPHGLHRAGSDRVYSDSLLAVTFLDGYVVSAILVPDLH
jgi:hypothetical protein